MKEKDIKDIRKDQLSECEKKEKSFIVEDCSRECFPLNVMDIKLLTMPKHLLKKCRRCNFKKRSCATNIADCTANEKKMQHL